MLATATCEAPWLREGAGAAALVSAPGTIDSGAFEPAGGGATDGLGFGDAGARAALRCDGAGGGVGGADAPSAPD